MLIYFRKTGVYVTVQILPRYLLWLLRNFLVDRNIRILARAVWAPKWHFRTPVFIAEALCTAQSLGVTGGWVRWDTDGSRRQICSPWQGKVCKISKEGAYLNIDDEVDLRMSMGDLAPRVLKHDAAQNAYAEEWIVSKTFGYSVASLERVRKALAENLYQVEECEVERYFRESALEFSEQARELASMLGHLLGVATLPISVVHGDMVNSNVSLRKNGTPILWDWEYARKCVVTQDIWFFLYQCFSNAKPSRDLMDFLKEFGSQITWAFPFMPDIRALHLIHLFEREALLLRNGEFVDSSKALKRVRMDIQDTLRLLANGI